MVAVAFYSCISVLYTWPCRISKIQICDDCIPVQTYS
jgi:hypothetical protein